MEIERFKMLPLYHHHHRQSWLKWLLGLMNARNSNKYYFFSVLCAIILSVPFLMVLENGSWSQKSSLNLSDYVRPDQVTTLIHPSTLHSYSNILEVVITVHSHPKHFEERDSIRHMWMHHAIATGKIAVIFCLGRSPQGGNTIDARVKKESEEFGDILLEDFIDTYDNLTVKSAMVLKYFHMNDIGTKVIFKAEDDVFVNPIELLRHIKYWDYSTNGFQKIMYGHRFKAVAPIRFTTVFASDKNAIMPKWMFGPDQYPTYLSGSGYIMAATDVSCLFSQSLKTPLLNLEDVFMTGILAEACGIQREHNAYFLPSKSLPCLLNDSNFILAHGMKLKDKEVIQEILTFGYSEHC